MCSDEAPQKCPPCPPSAATVKKKINRRAPIRKSTVFVPSFKVFEDFITKDSRTGKVDVSRIFTKRCFQRWIETRRSQNIKHPEQSFQRVLYAHLRGADKRQPFPEDVEKALLKVLRTPSEFNPWDEVFNSETKSMGRRGFRPKGFHEAQRQPISTTSNQSRGQSIILKKHDPVRRRKRQLSVLNIFLENFNLSPIGQTTAWDLLKTVVHDYVPANERAKSIEAAAARGVEIYSPSLYFYLTQPVNKEDIRFRWDFLIPDQESQFRDDRPVGTLVSEQMVIVTESLEAVEILGGSSIDLHIYQLQQSIVAVMFAAIRSVKVAAARGKVWLRQMLIRHDGKRIVALAQHELRNGKLIIFFQDHSDLYPQVLALPLLV